MKKNILILGGTSGIGLALVKQLEADNHLILASRSNESLSGMNLTYIPFDVETDSLDVSELPSTLDGLVYCPGTINLRPFKGLKPEVFEKIFQ